MSKPQRALLVIDVQNEYFTGGLRIEYPDPQRSLHHIGRAIDAANARGIPVIAVQQISPAQAALFAEGSHGGELHPVVSERSHDLLLKKTQPSAFVGTTLAQWLRARHIDTLSVIGYMTHNCDTATILDAAQSGLAVEFLADAAGSVGYANHAGAAAARTLHETFCVMLQSRFAAVLDTDTWVALLDGDAMPIRDSIAGSYQRALRERA